MSPPGTKLDQDKLAYHLIDGPAEAWLAATLTYGLAKYCEDGWKYVPDANKRYYSSLKRHLERWRAGEQFDEESGLHHLACVMFAAMCLTALNAPRDLGEIEKTAAEACRRWRERETPEEACLGHTSLKEFKACPRCRDHLPPSDSEKPESAFGPMQERDSQTPESMGAGPESSNASLREAATAISAAATALAALWTSIPHTEEPKIVADKKPRTPRPRQRIQGSKGSKR